MSFQLGNKYEFQSKWSGRAATRCFNYFRGQYQRSFNSACQSNQLAACSTCCQSRFTENKQKEVVFGAKIRSEISSCCYDFAKFVEDERPWHRNTGAKKPSISGVLRQQHRCKLALSRSHQGRKISQPIDISDPQSNWRLCSPTCSSSWIRQSKYRRYRFYSTGGKYVLPTFMLL